jgi:3-isopropylmalate/(R)-2-methylmalate dehydratase small subunit
MSERVKISRFSSHAVAIAADNIDTDQIIPARFLRTTDKDGLAGALFFAWRQDPAFVLNSEAAKTAKVLIAGDNFGCGSSREHAPWALRAFGFEAIVATSFADIFRNNALKNGLLPIAVSPEVAAELLAQVTDTGPMLTVDLSEQTLRFAGADGVERAVHFPIEAFSKKCLLEGLDELGYIMSHDAAIAAHETRAGD